MRLTPPRHDDRRERHRARAAAQPMRWADRGLTGARRSRRTPHGLRATLIGLILLLPLSAPADDPEARRIMQAVEDRDDGDDATQDMEMILIDKKGNRRIRMLRSFSKDVGEDRHTLMFFISPADVKDTGFLTYDYDDADRDDDQWLYLPALRKTKRIASSDKSGSFMGSDFNYSDMTERELERYDFRLMKEGEINGVGVWQIEAIPRTQEEIDGTGYEKSIFWVRQDNQVVIRALHWLKKGGKLRYFDVKKLEQIDGIWVPTEMHMTTKKGKKTLHKTVLRSTNVRFNQGLDKDLFTIRKLEKGL
ncbi:MAG: outer membrane lipoprotein-sorting protein [Myxococcota bacterium]